MFGIKKEKPTALDEVRKAYENLSDEDKKTFEQSIADRIHESVGEQEAENDQKDDQTAADREHEALGEEHAEGKGETDELGETDKPEDGKDEDAAKTEAENPAEEKPAEEAAEEKHEEAQEDKSEEAEPSDGGDLREVIKALEARVAELEKAADVAPKKASEEESDYLTALERKYNN